MSLVPGRTLRSSDGGSCGAASVCAAGFDFQLRAERHRCKVVEIERPACDADLALLFRGVDAAENASGRCLGLNNEVPVDVQRTDVASRQHGGSGGALQGEIHAAQDIGRPFDAQSPAPAGLV